jgi:hypothetical protein
MEYAVQDSRDLLAFARVLRRVAQEDVHDPHSDLLLKTAAALEARAFRLAIYGQDVGEDGREAPLPGPVNLLV